MLAVKPCRRTLLLYERRAEITDLESGERIKFKNRNIFTIFRKFYFKIFDYSITYSIFSLKE